MAAGFLSFIWNNKFGLPSLPPPGTFNGKTILITGASSGLGIEAAIHFVNLGASLVIITARNEARGNAAKEDILKRTRKMDKDVVKVMELDMGTFSSTKAFADRVKSEVKMIDYVLLNAGLLNVEFKQSSEGFEETIQVNVLSTALLGILLLPWIKDAGHGKAHLGFVTSGLHRFVCINGDFPRENILAYFNQEENWPKGPPRNPMYAISKLLEHYVINEIVRLSLGPDGKPGVIVNPMCPGLVKSNLARPYKTSFLKSLLVDIFYALVSKSTEGGARSLVIPALTTPAENGKFIKPYSTDEVYNAQAEKNITGPEGRRMQAQVWKEVLIVLEQKVPEVKEIVSQNTI